ncbi:hypothetical protein POSPLADRAFT_1133599 [Postia placenta MAD-698-R-SB12]|uniref:DUF6534 domain-containing protein n=1 Tax=Postia placenta MAD-698-R-SB12 TaxID=670580 RepID=A0A1X6N8D8_9APHY|nr:hypothetical protein POSPLADRAFT_1133599 [Postia placenta MAD-698-R-SB12]OSX64772.1 hypothetical protein POSPLADRAFT_1133599 [Postia placenta MAD-698-R-SB12]
MTDLPFELTMSCGLIFIGSLFGTLLFGIACAQTLYYFRRYPDDGLGIKMLSMLKTDIYRAFPAQYFLAVSTIKNVSRHLIAMNVREPQCRLPSCNFFIYTIFTVVNRKWFQYHLTIFMVLGPVTLAGYCITDIHIAVSLCLILWKQRTGIVRTNWLVSRLVLYSINRGVVSVVLELAEFTALLAGISLRSTSYKLLWIVFHFVNSKALHRGAAKGMQTYDMGRIAGQSTPNTGLMS